MRGGDTLYNEFYFVKTILNFCSNKHLKSNQMWNEFWLDQVLIHFCNAHLVYHPPSGSWVVAPCWTIERVAMINSLVHVPAFLAVIRIRQHFVICVLLCSGRQPPVAMSWDRSNNVTRFPWLFVQSPEDQIRVVDIVTFSRLPSTSTLSVHRHYSRSLSYGGIVAKVRLHHSESEKNLKHKSCQDQ